MMATRSRTEYDDALVSVAAEGRKEGRDQGRESIPGLYIPTFFRWGRSCFLVEDFTNMA